MIKTGKKGLCALFVFVKKRVLLSLLLLLVPLSGCGVFSMPSYLSGFSIHLPVGSQSVWPKPYYDTLDESQKEVYREIYRLSDRLDTQPLSLGDGLTAPEVREVLTAYYRDTPEHFWIVEGMETIWIEGDHIFVRLSYLFPDEDSRRQAGRQIEAALDRALANLRSNMDDFTKELTLHDWLIETCSYDQEAYEAILEGVSPTGRETSFSAWGALVEGKAACSGYARAMQLLLGAAGIPCTYLSGTGVDEETGKTFAHAWNVVTIGGEKYHVDATWNDRGLWSVQKNQYRADREGEHYVSHRYFNQTDKRMALDHQNFSFQGCDSIQENYFVRQGLTLKNLDQSEQGELVELLTRIGMENGQPLLEFWVPEDGQRIFDQMIHPEDGVLYHCLKAANQQIGKKLFQEGQAVAWYQEESGIITVRALYEGEE